MRPRRADAKKEAPIMAAAESMLEFFLLSNSWDLEISFWTTTNFNSGSGVIPDWICNDGWWYEIATGSVLCGKIVVTYAINQVRYQKIKI